MFRIELDLETASEQSLSDAVSLISHTLQLRATIGRSPRKPKKTKKSQAEPAPSVPAIDSAGVPFDPSIHLPGKSLDGLWRLREPEPSPAPEEISKPKPTSKVTVVQAPTPRDVSEEQEAPSAFRLVMRRVVADQQAGKLTREDVQALLKKIGLPGENIFELKREPEALCDSFLQCLNELQSTTTRVEN